jgi:uncharacterized surface anchored protein
MIQVYKTDPDGKALAGASFKITNHDTGVVSYMGPTDANGYTMKDDVEFGTYLVEETVFPEGYTAGDVTQWTITLGASTPQTITINAINNPSCGSITVQKQTNTGKNLGGWKVDLYDSEWNHLGIHTIADSGTLTISKLLPGTYYLTEQGGSDPYWVCDTETKTVTVAAGADTKVTLTNTHYGSITVQKQTNTGKNLGGWKVDLYDGKWMHLGVYTIPDSGTLTISNLLPGSYYLVEQGNKDAYWTYDTETKTANVTEGANILVTFFNTQYGRGKLIKAMPDGGSSAGWVFEVYRVSDNVHMGTYTSGSECSVLTDMLLPGEYQVFEQIPEGSLYYCESANPQEMKITAGQIAEVSFSNRIKPGAISIIKVNTLGERLAGAEFLLEWSADGSVWKPVSFTDSPYVTEGTCSSVGIAEGRLVSGEDGIVTFTGLHPQRLYRVTEVNAPEGYQLFSSSIYEGGISIENELLVELTVVNARIYELPMTGSFSAVILRVAQIIIAVVFLGSLISRLRKQR